MATIIMTTPEVSGLVFFQIFDDQIIIENLVKIL